MVTQRSLDEVRIGPGWKGHITLTNIDHVAMAIENTLQGKVFTNTFGVASEVPILLKNLQLDHLEVVKDADVINQSYIRLFISQRHSELRFVSTLRLNSEVETENPQLELSDTIFSVFSQPMKGLQQDEFFIVEV